MPSLSTATIQAQVTYSLLNSSGLVPIKTDTLTTGLKSALTVPTAANTMLGETLILTASGTSTIDMTSFTDPLGSSGDATKVLGILLLPQAGGGDVILSPGGSNGATWFLGGTTPTLTVKAGGALLYFEPVGTTVDGTHKTLLLTNASGSLACTVTVILVMKQ